jgi:ACS family pantothenate transporter-like MFS transporter
MWAMIATCIVLGIWTSGLLYMTNKAEKKRIVESEEGTGTGGEKNFEAGVAEAEAAKV